MPKYLFRANYTATGAAGVMKEGGTARQAAVTALVESLGGTVESMYWAFGPDDFFMIAEMPDSASVAAASLTVSASGAVRVTTAELMSAGQLDDVAKRSPSYRAPGT